MATYKIKIPPGCILKTKVSVELPDDKSIVSFKRISTNRSKWKFWLPKFVYQYQIIVPI